MGSGQRHSVEARRGWDGKSRAVVVAAAHRAAAALRARARRRGDGELAALPAAPAGRQRLRRWDFFFYEFDSPRQPAEESAQALYLFLRRMLTDAVYANPDLPAIARGPSPSPIRRSGW